jgi:hypothetical protein
VTKPQGVHLVGSVPLRDSAEVFKETAAILGERLRRVPDGETGERLGWISWQFNVLARHTELQVIPPDPTAYGAVPKVKLRRPGTALVFDRLGYAQAAIVSYAEFSRQKHAGAIHRECRFQVSLPTPLATVCTFVVPGDAAVVEPAYETRMLAELDEIAAAIPHDELAIQWDVAIEVANWERVLPAPFANVEQGIVERLVRLANRVPRRIELGFHLCYGDYEHRHFKQPANAAVLVELANAIAAEAARPVQWIHLPVPRDRADDAYFTPLRDLRLQERTELYLGLVHFTDGAAGTRQRIATAQRFVSKFGVATECGFGRRSPDTTIELLRVHAAVAGP